MDFDLELARKNAEYFKSDFAKGLRIEDLPLIGAGKHQKAFSYKNLVIKTPIDDALNDLAKIAKQYHDLLVQSSRRGIQQNLKFAPILDYIRNNKEFCTISPYIDGTELPDCTNQQMLDIGVDGMKRYLKNNIKLAQINLAPEIHDARNFKLSTQGNINILDYSTDWYPLWIYLNQRIRPRKRSEVIIDINYKSYKIISACRFDKKVMNNLRIALRQHET